MTIVQAVFYNILHAYLSFRANVIGGFFSEKAHTGDIIGLVHHTDKSGYFFSRITQGFMLYNQQHVYDNSNNDLVSSATVTSVVTMKIISYALYVAAHSVVAESLFANTSIPCIAFCFS